MKTLLLIFILLSAFAQQPSIKDAAKYVSIPPEQQTAIRDAFDAYSRSELVLQTATAQRDAAKAKFETVQMKAQLKVKCEDCLLDEKDGQLFFKKPEVKAPAPKP